MTKKSFTGENPALKYISMGNIENTEDEQITQYTDDTAITQKVQDIHTGKKESTPPEVQAHETKSKRLNVLIRPSLFEDAAKVAHMQRISVNELVHLAVERYVKGCEGDIVRFKEIYDQEKEKR